MVPHLAALAAAQGGVFLASQARAHGYSADEIRRLRRSGAWVALRRGVYIERDLAAGADARGRHILDIAAVLLASGVPLTGGVPLAGSVPPTMVASHGSAALLWCLRTLDPLDLAVVHLTTSVRNRKRNCSGLRATAAALPDSHLAQIGIVPVTGVARTTVDMVRDLSFRAGVVLADSALALPGMLKTELEGVLRYCRNWPGIRKAERVVAFANGKSESVAESVARVVFVEQRLPEPDPQVPVFDEEGLIGWADFVFEDQHTIAEIDGKLKYVEPETEEKRRRVLWREKKREDRLREVGYEVVRITWAELIYRPERVRGRLLAAFARAQRRHARTP